MHFDLTEDDRALVDGVRRVCADGGGWAALAEAGVFDLRVPEAEGGAGLGATEAVLVFEELGHALVPGPLVATHLAAGHLDGVVGALEVSPQPVLVEHLETLDWLVVVSEEGLAQVDPAGLDASPVPTPLDPLTPLHRLGAVPPGEPLGGPDEAARWRRDGALLTAALLAGIAGAVTELAVVYARQREQFNRPIGSFQAVKHLCADMHVRATVARNAVHAAGVTADDPSAGDAGRAVAGAKLLASQAAVANAKSCIQVHGGMGFTWEVEVHRYLKRAVVLSTHYGSAREHATAIAGLLQP